MIKWQDVTVTKVLFTKIVRHEDMPFRRRNTSRYRIESARGTFSYEHRSDYETVLGWAGQKLGTKFATHFDGATLDQINEFNRRSGIPRFGHTYLV